MINNHLLLPSDQQLITTESYQFPFGLFPSPGRILGSRGLRRSVLWQRRLAAGMAGLERWSGVFLWLGEVGRLLGGLLGWFVGGNLQFTWLTDLCKPWSGSAKQGPLFAHAYFLQLTFPVWAEQTNNREQPMAMWFFFPEDRDKVCVHLSFNQCGKKNKIDK